jgi:hypothetical protein
MATMYIRDIPEEVHQKIRVMAALSPERGINKFVVRVLTEATEDYGEFKIGVDPGNGESYTPERCEAYLIKTGPFRGCVKFACHDDPWHDSGGEEDSKIPEFCPSCEKKVVQVLEK